jgi:hypothetical protein
MAKSLTVLVRLEGFGPPACGLEVRCSIQLSYRRKIVCTAKIFKYMSCFLALHLYNCFDIFLNLYRKNLTNSIAHNSINSINPINKVNTTSYASFDLLFSMTFISPSHGERLGFA